MPVTEKTYAAIALEDPEGQWELHRGRLREKPSMTEPHNRLMARLHHQLGRQLDIEAYEVRMNTGRLRYGDEAIFIPDVMVVPTSSFGPGSATSTGLEILLAPMPFVAEVWSPSTGGYDVDTKIPEYVRRGDLEIWRLHPYERTVLARCRQPDGTYAEESHTGGTVALVALPNVVIDLDRLFAF
jgi:Uma2 family endonuclease